MASAKLPEGRDTGNFGDIFAIRNFVQLRPNIGTAGQPEVDQFPIIAEQGYVAVINLAMPDHQESISNEAEIVTKLGMSYTHIPVPFDSPQPGHVKQFCGHMKAVEDKKVFVHCIMNYRVSAFLFHYLNKVVGDNDDVSRSSMFDSWQPDSTWQQLLTWTRTELGL